MDLYYAVRRFYYPHITWSYKAYFLDTNKSYLFREQFLLHATWQLTWRILLNPYVGMVDSHGKTGFKDVWKHK